MNEVSNQSLQSVVLRAFAVKSKPTAKAGEIAGNNLPPAAKVERNSFAKVSNAESIKATVENVRDAIAEMSKYTQSIQRDIQFDVDDASGRTVVTVVDRQTQQIIRQIPDEVFLKLARTLKESLATGDNQAFHLMSERA